MTVKTSRVGSNEVLIVGTAHISKKSREEVKDTILENRPDIIGVELDEGRYSNIMDKDSWKNKDIYKIIREGKSHMFLANVMLSNYQKRLGEELGTTPGAEMMEAIELAGESSELALLDRDINITFKRAWKNMSLREKLKILYSIMFSFLEEGEEINEEMIEKIKEEDMLNSMLEELSGEIPNIKSTLIDERDAYIAGKIKEVLKGKDNKKMVAVVGAGHMNGIVSGLERDIDTRSLETIPPGRSYLKIVMWAVPLLRIPPCMGILRPRKRCDPYDAQEMVPDQRHPFRNRRHMRTGTSDLGSRLLPRCTVHIPESHRGRGLVRWAFRSLPEKAQGKGLRGTKQHQFHLGPVEEQDHKNAPGGGIRQSWVHNRHCDSVSIPGLVDIIIFSPSAPVWPSVRPVCFLQRPLPSWAWRRLFSLTLFGILSVREVPRPSLSRSC